MSKFQAVTVAVSTAMSHLEKIPAETLNDIKGALEAFPARPYDNRAEAKKGSDPYLMLTTDDKGVATLAWSAAAGTPNRPLVVSDSTKSRSHMMLLYFLFRGWPLNKIDNRFLNGGTEPKQFNCTEAADFDEATSLAFGDVYEITAEGYLAKKDGDNRWTLSPADITLYEEGTTFAFSQMPAHIVAKVKEGMEAAIKGFDLSLPHTERFNGKAKVTGAVDEEEVTLILGDYTVTIAVDKGSCNVSYNPGAKFKKGGLPTDFQEPMVSAATVLYRLLGIKDDPKLFGNNPPRVLTPEEQEEADLRAALVSNLAEWNRF